MDTIPIPEAEQQLQESRDEVARIKAKIAELQASGSAVEMARRERQLAEAILEGADVSAIVPPALTSSQLRRAIQALEMTLAEALDHENQAAGALRRAKLSRTRELLAQEREAYDATALDLMQRWLRVTLLSQHVDAATGMGDTLGAPWYRFALPRGAVPRTSSAFFDESMHFASARDLLMSVKANAARADVQAILRKEGLQ